MKVLVCFLVALCLVHGRPEISAQKRNYSGEEAKKDPECAGRLPCGWLVYNKSTRVSEFFMNNTCICSEEKQCVQTDDDLSVGAYVYRCLGKILRH